MKWQIAIGYNIIFREQKLNDFSRVCYIHIPKTAGRTIRNTLGPKGLIIPPKPRRGTNHFRYEQYDHNLYDIYFSTIRDPLDWLQSYYYFVTDRHRRGKRDRQISKFESFEEFISKKGYIYIKNKFGYLTQSEWVTNIPLQNLLRVSHLQEDLNLFSDENNLIRVELKNTGINSLRNRKVKIDSEIKSIIENDFADDYNLIDKINNYRDVRSKMEIVYD